MGISRSYRLACPVESEQDRWEGQVSMIKLPQFRRQRLVLLVVTPAALLGLGLFLLLPSSRPDASNKLRIESGMTEADVNGIFGCKADGDRSDLFDSSHRDRMGPGFPKYWICDAGVVEVWFDERGRVIGSSFLSHDFKRRPSLFHRFLRWLGL
jgi:hypothetical protein